MPKWFVIKYAEHEKMICFIKITVLIKSVPFVKFHTVIPKCLIGLLQGIKVLFFKINRKYLRVCVSTLENKFSTVLFGLLKMIRSLHFKAI